MASVAGISSLLVGAAGKPNVIVIVGDDCGYNEFSFQGSKIRTPRIDSIAANGVRCTDGYVSGPVCSPTRAGLLTGRYQQRFGHEFNVPPVSSETNGLPLTETVLAEPFKAAGYRTIAIGKWHLGYDPKFNPVKRGFTDYYGFLQGARSYRPLEKPTNLNQILRGHDPVKPEKFDYLTDHLAEEAVAYMTKHRNDPFLIYLAFNATHTPLEFAEADLIAANKSKIGAMTIALDRAVGKVLDGLKELGLSENTLVFFISDNGGPSGHDNSPLRDFKGSCWEGGIRVPFAVQWPAGLPKGVVYDAPVIALDILPTALAAAGIEPKAKQPLDGVNLLPYLAGENNDRPHQTLYWKMGRNGAVRAGDLKLVLREKQKPGMLELFDLSKDVSEKTDLATVRPGDVKRLKGLYDTWVKTHKPTPWANGRDE